MIKTEDIPGDVFWVWNIQWSGYPVGLETWNKADEIIRANPKYFPWEAKYYSIPQYVHDAYFKEKNAEWDRIWDEKQDAGFKGIIPTLLEMDQMVPDPATIPEKSLTEILSDLFKMQENKRKAEEAKYMEDKVLWDKYYKPYGNIENNTQNEFMNQMKCKPIEQDIWEKAKQRARDSFEDIGIMGSFVGLIDNKVVAKILDTDEILQLLSLYDHINEIPKEYTFYLD